MKTLIRIFSLFAGLAAFAAPPNILFIAVDDLRPELGCYGAEHMKTPYIDGLAASGFLFERAFCQQAVCNPSRASLMSGLRPDTLGVYDLETPMRKNHPNLVSLSQHFKNHGYHAERIGKIYHMGHGVGDDPASWTRPNKARTGDRFGPEGMRVLREAKRAAPKGAKVRGLPVEAPDVGDDELRDGAGTAETIRLMEELAAKDQPFFVAMGYANPHLPFVSPKKYWDLYDRKEVGLAEHRKPSKDAPAYAASRWGEIRAYIGIPKKGPISDEQARELRHGYYAAVSYVDAQVGRLLTKLEELNIADNTIVVLWGDHGWKLGDLGQWCKHTNYEIDARVPMIIRAPGVGQGKRTRGLTEFVDIYPTLCELAGLPVPEHLEGISAVMLMNHPDTPWKTAAFSQYPRRTFMGYSLKTDTHRFVVWVDRATRKKIDAVELYDHRTDPAETVNVAAKPENVDLVKRLTAQALNDGWKRSLPPAVHK